MCSGNRQISDPVAFRSGLPKCGHFGYFSGGITFCRKMILSIFLNLYAALHFGRKRRRRLALVTTVTELKAIAAPAMSGDSSTPKNG